MADFTTPMFCLPVAVTASPSAGQHLTVTFADSSIGATTITVTLGTGSVYNNRAYSHADNLAKQLVDKLNAAELAKFGGAADGTWTASELTSGDMKGMLRLSRAAGDQLDDLTNIIFDDTELTGNHLGYATDTVTPTSGSAGNTYTWDGVYVCSHQWIPHQTGPQHALMVTNEPLPEDFITGPTPEETAATELTQDHYGTHTFRQVSIMTVWGASMLEWCAADSDYLLSGQTVNDPNVTWDDFRQVWRDASGDAKKARFHADMDDATTYVQLLPLQPWISAAKRGVKGTQPAPYKLDLDIRLWQV